MCSIRVVLLGVMVAAAAGGASAVEARDEGRMRLGGTAQHAETPGAFGPRLAAAARRQTSHLVFYNPAYQ